MPEGVPTIQPAKTTEYETPRDLFDQLWDEVGATSESEGFDLDPFCQPHQYTARVVLRNGGTIMVPPDCKYEGTHPEVTQGVLDGRILTDGLAHPWHGKVWMNPPYGAFLRNAIPYAVGQVECGNAEFVMGLLPAKTEVRWWQEYILREAHQPGPGTGWLFAAHRTCRLVRFLRGRLHFGGGEGPARVGSVLVVWRK